MSFQLRRGDVEEAEYDCNAEEEKSGETKQLESAATVTLARGRGLEMHLCK